MNLRCMPTVVNSVTPVSIHITQISEMHIILDKMQRNKQLQYKNSIKCLGSAVTAQYLLREGNCLHETVQQECELTSPNVLYILVTE